MASNGGRRWLVGAFAIWTLLLGVMIVAGVYFHNRSVAILEAVVTTDPSPTRRALRLRLEADGLVREAFLRHEEATTGSATAGDEPGALVAEAAPLLEKAERLYLESLDAASSQPALLFQLGEVNFLLGRRPRAYLYLAEFWAMRDEADLARIYRQRARELDPTVEIPPSLGRQQ